jgi:phosphopantothenoylcysteine synthetase/decarboxylase
LFYYNQPGFWKRIQNQRTRRISVDISEAKNKIDIKVIIAIIDNYTRKTNLNSKTESWSDPENTNQNKKHVHKNDAFAQPGHLQYYVLGRGENVSTKKRKSFPASEI